MRKVYFLILVQVLCTVSFAQTFKGEAPLPKVETDGFYRIPLSPELSKYLNNDFSNIRIYKANEEVPYLLQTESPSYFSEEFKEYEITEKQQVKNCCTSLILRNPEGNSINNIILSIKNAEVLKHATLLGSDDKAEWFALKQSFQLTAITNESKTSEIKIVDFPLSNYSYYQVQIDDSTSAPLNILKAGYHMTSREEGKFTEIPQPSITKSDSVKEKKTFVRIQLDTLRTLDRLSLTMTGAPYFLRHATLYGKQQRVTKKKEIEFYYEYLTEFELSSKQTSLIEFSGLKVNELLVEIDNQDNPPLQVSSLSLYQLNRYLTVWLKSADRYLLKIGSEEMEAPQYDLVFFKDKIPTEPQVINTGVVSMYEEKQVQSFTLFTNRMIIWIAIGVIAIVLAVMSFKLINEASSRKE